MSILRLPVAAGLLLVLLAAGAAQGHADLVGTYPPGDTEVEHAPERLVLVFSEPLEDVFTRIRVYDVNGTQYARPTHVEGSERTRAAADLPPLADGHYLVLWRTLGVDAHPKEGRYLLAVNASLEDAPPIRGRAALSHWGGAASLPEAHGGHNLFLRGLGYLGLFLAWGLPLFALQALRRAPTDLRWETTTASAAATVAGAIAGLDIFVYVGAIEAGLGQAFDTTGGMRLLTRFLLLLAAGIVLFLASRASGSVRRYALGGGLALVLGAMATTALLSHAAGSGRLVSVPILLDLVHLLAVATWVGGVLALLLMLARRTDAEVLGDALARFRPVALVTASLAVLTGSLVAFGQLDAPRDLVRTPYGLVLSLKILGVVALVGLATRNAVVNGPRAGAAPPDDPLRGKFLNSVAFEVVAMTFVLLLAAALTGIDPP